MRAWQDALHASATSLAGVLVCEPAGVDLDVTMCARAVVLEHVATVLGDVVPRTKGHLSTRRIVPIGLAETDPLLALGHLLHQRHRPALAKSPSELLGERPGLDPITGHWAAAGRHALTANRAWASVGPLAPEAAWHTVGHVAALAEAVAVLDRDLVAAATGRPELCSVLASTAGLRLVAREVMALAGPGPDTSIRATPGPRQDAAAIKAALAARADRPSTIDRDVRRLTALLGRTTELTPSHVRSTAVVARNLAVITARDAVGRDGAPLRPELGELARALHAVARHGRGEFALNPARPRTLELQLRDLHATTTVLLARRNGLGPDQAGRIARRLPDLVNTLTERTRAQIEHANWAVPDRTPTADLPYAIASTTDPVRTPPVLDRLTEASDLAAGLRAKAVEPAAYVPAPSPLAAALAARAAGPSVERPLHPAQVAQPRRGSRPAPER